jgi:hypothetical protein
MIFFEAGMIPSIHLLLSGARQYVLSSPFSRQEVAFVEVGVPPSVQCGDIVTLVGLDWEGSVVVGNERVVRVYAPGKGNPVRSSCELKAQV